jgi:enterochelin esterase-like enzyme
LREDSQIISKFMFERLKRTNAGSRKSLYLLTARLILLLVLGVLRAAGQVPTYSAAGPDDSPAIAHLQKALATDNTAALKIFWAGVRKSGAPLIEAVPNENGFSFVTFLWRGDDQTRNVVIFDGVAAFDAKDRMLNLGHTDVWYKTYRVRNDARFAYNLSPNDSLQPFDDVKGDEAMRNRLAVLQVDPLNPHRCPTTFGAYGADSSYVQLPGAPPLLWNSPAQPGRKGKVAVATIQSGYLKGEKKLWVYTPAGFPKDGALYPLLVLFDGDRNVMWIPRILDILIAQKRIPPIVAIMTDESVPSARRTELPCNPQFANFLAKELVPWARKNYHATTKPERTVVAGSSFGGLAAVFAGLQHPDVFGNVISLSGSFWWKPDDDKKREWLTSLIEASPKVALRFYLEVGLMESYSMQVDENRHMRAVLAAKGYPLHYFEYDGGHSFLNWSGGMADGLQFILAAH